MISGRLAWSLFAAGLLLRAWELTSWGTYDTEVQKAWSVRAVKNGVADIYGPSDEEIIRLSRERRGLLRGLLEGSFPRTIFQWGTADYFVDYPPGSVLILWAAGKLYELFDPGMRNHRFFNAAINLTPLLASVLIAGLLYRSCPGETGRLRATLFWLNPAVFLAVPLLGYQDTVFGALGLMAVMCLMRGQHVTATGLVVAASLVKPQGVLLLPTLLALLAREAGPRLILKALAVGFLVAAVILLPWWWSGHLLSALDGCRRPLGQGTLAPLGFNVWWLAGYVMQWARGERWPLARIATIDAFRDWAGFNPRSVALVLLLAMTLLQLALLLRAPREDRRFIVLSVILQVHAFALFGTSVHENHTFLAVVLAGLLIRAWPKASAFYASTSTFLFVSLFFTAGFGRRVIRQRTVEAIRMVGGLDLSVLLAASHIVLVTLLVVWIARTGMRATTGGGTASIRPSGAEV